MAMRIERSVITADAYMRFASINNLPIMEIERNITGHQGVSRIIIWN